jgi:hypothetical protein
VAWQGRDWARWNDGERQRHTGTPPGLRRTRVLVWSALGALVVGLLLLAWALRSSQPLDSDNPSPLSVERGRAPDVYLAYMRLGTPWNPYARAREPTYIGPDHVICTRRTVDTASRLWVCSSWTVVRPGMRIVYIDGQLPQDAVEMSARKARATLGS